MPGWDWRAERKERRSLRIVREEIVDPICDALLNCLEALTFRGILIHVSSIYARYPRSSMGAHDFGLVSSKSDPESYLSDSKTSDDETVTSRGYRRLSRRRQSRETLRRPRSRVTSRANKARMRTVESSRAWSPEMSLEAASGLSGEEENSGLTVQPPTISS